MIEEASKAYDVQSSYNVYLDGLEANFGVRGGF